MRGSSSSSMGETGISSRKKAVGMHGENMLMCRER